MEGLEEAALWHMIDTSNIRERHPGADRTDIPCQNTLMIPLKGLIGLHSTDCGEDDTRQGQT